MYIGVSLSRVSTECDERFQIRNHLDSWSYAGSSIPGSIPVHSHFQMNKFVLTIQGYISCFGWIFTETYKAILEQCPDLKLWDIPTHPDDFLCYAERVNGRLAMLALTGILGWKYINLIYAAHHVQ